MGLCEWFKNKTGSGGLVVIDADDYRRRHMPRNAQIMLQDPIEEVEVICGDTVVIREFMKIRRSFRNYTSPVKRRCAIGDHPALPDTKLYEEIVIASNQHNETYVTFSFHQSHQVFRLSKIQLDQDMWLREQSGKLWKLTRQQVQLDRYYHPCVDYSDHCLNCREHVARCGCSYAPNPRILGFEVCEKEFIPAVIPEEYAENDKV